MFFITSGLVSLFTNEEELKTILTKTHNLLSEDGVFVFAVDTIKSKLEDDIDYKEFVSVKTHEGYKLILKSKNRFDIETSIQYSPSIYKLYDGNRLLQF